LIENKFDRKYIWSKIRFIENTFDRKFIWPKIYLLENTFYRKYICSTCKQWCQSVLKEYRDTRYRYLYEKILRYSVPVLFWKSTVYSIRYSVRYFSKKINTIIQL